MQLVQAAEIAQEALGCEARFGATFPLEDGFSADAFAELDQDTRWAQHSMGLAVCLSLLRAAALHGRGPSLCHTTSVHNEWRHFMLTLVADE